MIKSFKQYINEDYNPEYVLILEDHRFDENPGEDFGENWEKLDQSDEIFRYVKSRIPHGTGDREPGIYSIFRVSEHYNGETEVTGYHYVLQIHGGENGSGKWENYFEYLRKLFANFEDAWVIDLINDCADDVWDLRLCFRIGK